VRALRGGIPRGLPSHRTPEAFQYRGYVQALMMRLGLRRPIDADVRAWLKEAGRSHLALDRLHGELVAALGKPNRKREARRLERLIFKHRGQLLGLEAHLAELARPYVKPLVERLNAGGRT
jgi:hypothetical protein